jgi:hypothetical protein
MIANLSNAKKEGLVQLIAANGKNALTTLQILSSEEVMRITAVATGHGSRTIIDFLTGQSSFMQRFSGGASAFSFNRINFGVGEIEYPGTAASVTISPVAHGLGTTPKVVVAFDIQEPSAGVGWLVYTTWAFTETGFAVKGRTLDGGVIGPGKVPYAWIAIA